ncbi:M1 family metallopeptidase [Mesoterricola sediminis]|uniref:Aminopeptidase N n=1 Tax=Mesoterricola sediminis TaxID=2927980 RepID=A0AA48GU36_9BACT|nr:M1 family metallopeptidase [Mesoterricola sediminis]BDU77784.1 aminopeptidase [Mesoterricola sediminis]
MARPDPHSYFDDAQPRTERWHLRFLVDFERKVLGGEATLVLAEPSEGLLDLDTKGLTIYRAWVPATDVDVPFELGPEDPILGRRLRLQLPAGTGAVVVAYETSPAAMGLQWLEPAQTEGGRHPFLFSQCQAIHARTLVPCQDCAVARVAYNAEVVVPEGLTAVMSAGPDGDEPGPIPGTRAWRFRMPQPIPSYLLALAVGELEGRDLSHRSRVWAEPATIERAAWEFAGVEDMIVRAEGLFGPYDWDRYDMLVLPPSFPYGGMENPRMTFLTPTLLAGDRSLVDVVAHELAHSWTGNLVTNATAEHFWLNEGFTVWAERKILKALRGQEAYAIGWAIGQKALDESLARFKDAPELTVLRTHLEGVDPDDAFSSIPYEKGARLVALMEREAGEETFAAFVQAYMKRFRFTSITTEQWQAFVEERLPGLLARIGADDWLHKPGMPANAPVFRSETLEALEALGKGFPGHRPDAEAMKAWTPTELLVFLQNLPRVLPLDACAWLDRTLALTGRGNHEILVEWLVVAAGSGYEAVFPRVREVLSRVGRMKYLRPLYGALGRTAATRALARDIFAQASPGYHGLSRRVVQGVMDKYPA